MPIMKIPSPFRYYTAGQAEVVVTGHTVRDCMNSLIASFPSIQKHLYKPNGELRAFVNLFVNTTNINNLQGLETPLNEDDELRLIPAIAGG